MWHYTQNLFVSGFCLKDRLPLFPVPHFLLAAGHLSCGPRCRRNLQTQKFLCGHKRYSKSLFATPRIWSNTWIKFNREGPKSLVVTGSFTRGYRFCTGDSYTSSGVHSDKGVCACACVCTHVCVCVRLCVYVSVPSLSECDGCTPLGLLPEPKAPLDHTSLPCSPSVSRYTDRHPW